MMKPSIWLRCTKQSAPTNNEDKTLGLSKIAKEAQLFFELLKFGERIAYEDTTIIDIKEFFLKIYKMSL